MSKKNTNGNLGSAMIKHRLHKGVNRKTVWVHTSELPDNSDWNRINFNSVTEQNSLDEFLNTAELAGTEFTCERLNINFVEKNQIGVVSSEEKAKIKKAQDENRDLLRIPRRPLWKDHSELDTLEYQQKERDSFLEWRRRLAQLQETQNVKLTPFEKNIEFWKQLWRVIERSDLIVQIVDARNPLLFRCADLESYVKEVNANKLNLLLVNKSDYLTLKQRLAWLEYFEKNNIQVVFWSALIADTPLDVNKTQSIVTQLENDRISEKDEDEERIGEEEEEEEDEDEDEGEEDSNEESQVSEKEQVKDDEHYLNEVVDEQTMNKCKVLNREELIELFKSVCSKIEQKQSRTHVATIGMVGYPNVGKSSTINAILQTKRVAVSETPGKTKHYQTLYVDDDLILCDCPGLVFPSFVCTRGELIINGILPVDQMRDYMEPINLITSQLPKRLFEIQYGLILPKPREGELCDRVPTAEELCSTYAKSHGFMNHKGMPDVQRAARCILKDYINGKLIYCYPPPNLAETQHESFQEIKIDPIKEAKYNERLRKIEDKRGVLEGHHNEFDSQFFQKLQSKGIIVIKAGTRLKANFDASSSTNTNDATNKPWKKHKNKKEKLRRLYSHLDA